MAWLIGLDLHGKVLVAGWGCYGGGFGEKLQKHSLCPMDNASISKGGPPKLKPSAIGGVSLRVPLVF